MSVQIQEMSLSLGDRLNYPYIIASQIQTVQRTMETGTEREIYEAILGLRYLIPNDWEDPEFKEDLEKAQETVLIDLRPRWCGIPVGKIDDPLNSIKQKRFLAWPLFHACINQFKRLNLLTKMNYTEISTGNDFIPILEIT